jgi:ribosomal-protein-alanine N-acetyltransferase
MSEIKVFPFIEGTNISLCAPNIENVKLYASWDNHPDVRKYSRNLFPVNPEDNKKYIEKGQDRIPSEIGFEIWHNEDKKPIGFVGFNYIMWADRVGNIGLTIGEPAYWNQNLGLEATFLIIEYGFNELNLIKITGSMYEMNIGSWKICEKIGMKRELLLKKNAFVKGKYVDEFEYCLFNEDWKLLRQKFNFK